MVHNVVHCVGTGRIRLPEALLPPPVHSLRLLLLLIPFAQDLPESRLVPIERILYKPSWILNGVDVSKVLIHLSTNILIPVMRKHALRSS